MSGPTRDRASRALLISHHTGKPHVFKSLGAWWYRDSAPEGPDRLPGLNHSAAEWCCAQDARDRRPPTTGEKT